MKKRTPLAAALALAGACAYGTEWPSSGDVTVPAGETWIATEADMAKVNALSSITVEGPSGDETPAGVLEFSGCTTLPKAGLLKGTGVVRKTGSEVWDWGVANADFNGDFRICGGQVKTSVSQTFGKTTDGCKGAVYVEDGASLKITAGDVKFAYRPIHIAGNGFGTAAEDKALSIVKATSGVIGRLYLDADATIYVKNDENHYWLSNQATPSGVAWLGEHALTKTGGMDWCFLGATWNGGSLINGEGNLVLREQSNLGDSDAGPFVVAKAARAQYYNNPNVIRRPLRVDGTMTFTFACNNSTGWREVVLSTNRCNWAGDVVLNGKSSKLVSAITYYNAAAKLVETANDLQFSFMGDISGDGSVEVGSSTRDAKGRTALGGHNAYTGTTTVYGGYSSRLQAYWFDSIPDYAKLTVDRGYVAARLGFAVDGKTERWPKEKLFALHNTATFKDDGAFALDAEELEGAYDLTAKELLECDVRHDVGWGVAGGVVRITAEADDRLPIVPCAYRGTLELCGPGVFETVGTNSITSVAGVFTNGSTVVVRDGATVEQGAFPVFIGRKYNVMKDYPPLSYATLLVSNATWRSVCDVLAKAESNDSLHTNLLYVGSSLRGVLDIQDGGFVSNKVVIGGGGHWNNQFSGEGAAYVGRGGRLYVAANGDQAHIASQLGYCGYGYLQVEPEATAEADGAFSFGAYGLGIYHQYGGTFVKHGSLAIASCNGGQGVLYLSNGVFRTESARGNAYVQPGVGGYSARAFLTVDGPDASFEVGGTDPSIYLNQRVDNETRISLNNGGCLTTSRLVPYAKAANATVAHPIIMTFDGGILRKQGKDYSPFIFQYPQTVEFAVYAGGAEFDTGDACAENVWDARCPLLGRVAGGVQSVDASAAVAKGGWLGAPHVVIGGDGAGATAVADWDWKTRTLKGVRITSHGWGYTPEKVTVTIKTAMQSVTISNAAEQLIAVGDNDIGGFTKSGSTLLTMNGTNSWQKWTAVNGGTLRAGSNGAIPSGTELRLNGGTIDLGHFDEDAERPVTFCGLAGTGGAVVNGAAKLKGEWRISARRFLDRESTVIEGKLDLSEVTKIVIADAELLDESASRLARLSLFSATDVIWPATLAVEGVPEGWRATRTATGFKLGFDKGLVLILR